MIPSYLYVSAYDNVSMALGHPVQVVIAQKDQSFDLDLEALEKILLNPRVCDKKVAVLSIAGSCRKGKSFLLNFFLKYLQARVGIEFFCSEYSFHLNVPLVEFYLTRMDNTLLVLHSSPRYEGVICFCHFTY